MWSQLVLIVALAFLVTCFDESFLEQRLTFQLEDYIKTKHISEEFKTTLKEIELRHFFRQNREVNKVESRIACVACRSLIAVFSAVIKIGVSDETLTDLAINLCILLKIEAEHVCRGAVINSAATILYIFRNKPSLTAAKACSILMKGHICQNPDEQDWSINIPPRIPYTVRTKSPGKPLNVLHISDIHFDPKYTIGAAAECVEPMCCQADSTPKNSGSSAGRWGDYRNCDISMDIVTNALDHIRTQHKDIDFIYYTGDIIDHRIWDTSIEGNKLIISKILNLFKQYFGNIPVYSVLGNHEPHPVDLFSSEGVHDPKVTNRWIYELSAEEWQFWLPPETKDTILKGGYYTVSPKPGFRIIAINSNLGYSSNFWLLYNDTDPSGQLQWFANTLAEAEKNGEIVHVLSHIPTGSQSGVRNWSKVYIEVINRFSHIIAGQFIGHTHADDTVIFFDLDNPSKANNVAFNGGSLTTFSHVNPNYKVYSVDSETLQVLDFESWTYNVTAANLTPDAYPIWYKLYSFKEAYGVQDLTPNEIFLLAKTMTKRRDLTEKYFRYKYREADTRLEGGCDDECQIKNLCSMVTTNFSETLHCEILTELFNETR